MRGKVAVIGGGTAGSLAAKALAEKGINVQVYEQKAVVGHPIHASGILSLAGLGGLGIDYKAATTNTLRGANLHAAGETLHVRAENPVAVVLERSKLNEICIDGAISAGAAVETRRRISASELEAKNRDSVIVGADGAFSTVAAHFSLGHIARYLLTYKAEYNVSAVDREVVDLFFDNVVSRGLFGWICPNVQDVVEIGIGVDSRFGNGRRAFERFLQVKEVAELVDGQKQLSGGASMIPMRRRERIVDEKKGVLLVGDAAGQVKATTGGGIIFGGNGALMAAEAIGEYMQRGEPLSSYERAFMKRYGLEMRLHYLVNRFYSSMSTVNLGRMIAMSKILGLEAFLGRYGDMDLPSLVIKRFFLRGLAD